MVINGECLLKKVRCLNSSGRTKKQEAQIILELRQSYSLEKLLVLSKLKRSTYYYHSKEKLDKYEREKEAIRLIFNKHQGRYGYRRVLLELQARNHTINHKTVLKLMKGLNLQGKQRKNKYKSYKGEVGKIAPNIISRDFSSTKPLTKLATDVTEFSVCQEKIYLSPVIDMYNNEIVSYSISKSPNFYQTKEMLKKLFNKIPKNSNAILHSDQGWQYQMKEYQRLLKERNITASMSRKGNCLDNSVMENFFGRLKVEMFYGEKFESVDAFIVALHKYIKYYNNERIVTKLKTSPIKYRTCN